MPTVDELLDELDAELGLPSQSLLSAEDVAQQSLPELHAPKPAPAPLSSIPQEEAAQQSLPEFHAPEPRQGPVTADDLLDEIEAEQAAKRAEENERLGFLLRNPLAQDANQYAAILDISNRTGVAPKYVEHNFDRMRLAAEGADFDPERFRQDEPWLATMLLQYPPLGKLILKERGILTQFIGALVDDVGGVLRGMAVADDRRTSRRVNENAQPYEPQEERAPLVDVTPTWRYEVEDPELSHQSGPTWAWNAFRKALGVGQKQVEMSKLGNQIAGLDLVPGNIERLEEELRNAPLLAEIEGSRRPRFVVLGELEAERAKLARRYELEKRLLELRMEARPANFGQDGLVGDAIVNTAELLPSQWEAMKGAGKVGGATIAASTLVGAAIGGATTDGAGIGAGAQTGFRIGLRLARWTAAAGAGRATFPIERGSAYLEYRDLTLDDGTPLPPEVTWAGANVYALIASSIEAGDTLIDISLLTGGAKGGALAGDAAKGVLKSRVAAWMAQKPALALLSGRTGAAMKGAASEGGEEGLQQATQDFIAWATRSAVAGAPQSADLAGSLDSIQEAATAAFLGGGMTGAGMHTAGGAVQFVAEAELAQRVKDAAQFTNSVEGLKQVNAFAQVAKANSPLVKADPAAAAEIFQSATRESGSEVTSLHVDAHAFMQESERLGRDPMELAREVLGENGAERLTDALTTGNKIELPVKEYLTTFGPSEVGQALVNDTTVRADDLSRNEIGNRLSDEKILEAEVAQLVKKYETEEAELPPDTSEAEVRYVNTLRRQLVATGVVKDGAAKKLIAAERAFIRTQAQRFGVSPDALFEGYTLRIERQQTVPENVAAQVYTQVDNAALREAIAPEVARAQEARRNLEVAADENKAAAEAEFRAADEAVQEAVKRFHAGSKPADAQVSIGGVPIEGEALERVEAMRQIIRKSSGASPPVRAWAMKTLARTTVRNAATGADVYIGRIGINEIAARRSLPSRTALAMASDLLAVATPIDAPVKWGRRDATNKGRRTAHFSQKQSLGATFELGGETFEALFTVASTRRGLELYDLSTKKVPGVAPSREEAEASSHRNSAGTERNVAAPSSEVKSFAQRPADGAVRGYTHVEPTPGGRKAYTIGLLPGAKQDTILHEFAHSWLLRLSDFAARPDAPEQVKTEWAALRRWLGVEEGAELTREHHEKFAQTAEIYLSTGKAPSKDLRSAFRKFRDWLGEIWKSIRRPDLDIDPEGFQFFDRMLATDEEIAEARARSGADMGFKEKPPSMSDTDWAAYQDAREKTRAAEEAVAASKSYKAKLSELGSIYAQHKREELDKARREYDALPVVQAYQYIRHGKYGGVKVKGGPKQLHRKTVETIFGKERSKEIDGLLSNDGANPTDVAKMFEFESAQKMLWALLNRQDREPWANREATKEMRRKHPQLSIDRAKLRELLDKVQHGAQGNSEAIAMEWVHLGATPGGNDPSIAAIKEAARRIAMREPVLRITAKKYLNAERRAAAQSQAATLAGKTMLARVRKRQQLLNSFIHGYMLEAQELKRRFVKLATQLRSDEWRDRIDLADQGYGLTQAGEANKTVPPDRRGLLGLNDGLLEALGLKQPEDRPVAQAFGEGGLFEGVRRMDSGHFDDQGNPIDGKLGFDEGLVSDLLRHPKSYLDLTLEEFQGVYEAMKRIRSLGVAASDVEVEGKRRAQVEMASEIHDAMSGRRDKRFLHVGASTYDPKSKAQEKPGAIRKALASTIEGAETFRRMGPLGEGLWQRVMNSTAKANDITVENETKLRALYDEHVKDLDQYELIDIPGVPPMRAGVSRTLSGRISRQDLWVLALHYFANLGNRQRLLDGFGWNAAVSVDGEAQLLKAFKKNLSSREMAFLQGIMDLFEAMRPESDRVAQATRGRGMGRVPPMFDQKVIDRLSAKKALTATEKERLARELAAKRRATHTFADGVTLSFAGGYVPAVQDGKSSLFGQMQSDDGIQSVAASAGARVAQGFTRTRSATADAPLLIDFGIVANHIRRSANYQAREELVRDLVRLGRQPMFKSAMERYQGAEYMEQYDKFVKRLAQGSESNAQRSEAALFLGMLKKPVVTAIMGFNFKAIAADWLTFLQMVRPDPAYASAFARTMARTANPTEWKAMRKEALDASGYVRLRANGMSEKARRLVNEIGPDGNPGGIKGKLRAIDRKLDTIQRATMAHLEISDSINTTIMWHTARAYALEKLAIEEKLVPAKSATTPEERAWRDLRGTVEGESREAMLQRRAVEMADAELRKYLPAASAIEQSNFEQSELFHGLFMLVRFWMRQGHNLRRNWDIARQERTAAGYALFLGRYLYDAALIGVAGSFFSGEGPEEDENVGLWATRMVFRYPGMSAPLLPAVTNSLADGFASLIWTHEFKYDALKMSERTNPGASLIFSVYRDAVRGTKKGDAMALVTAGMTATGLPALEAKRIARYFDSYKPQDLLTLEGQLGFLGAAIYGENERSGANPVSIVREFATGD